MSCQLDLNGAWKMACLPHNAFCSMKGEDHLRSIAEIEEAFPQVIDAQVPGNLELDLVREGVEKKDPFFGENIYSFHRYESYHAVYYRRFSAPEVRADADWFLVFEGLDTYAAVYLNGKPVLEADNMLIPHEADVTALLQKENELVVHLRPTCIEARQYPYTPLDGGLPYNTESMYVRKAPHMYGWDIMPRAVSLGIWRGVRLERREKTRLEEVYMDCTAVSGEGGTASMRLFYRLKTELDYLENMEIRFSGICGESRFCETRMVTFIAGVVYFGIGGARLWWPKNYGDPALYDVKVELLQNGILLHEKNFSLGIRVVEIDRTLRDPRGPGDVEEGFCILVNHRPIFVMGTNWVPLDAYHSRDARRLPEALRLLEESGCNLARCWGGNVYEDHAFFDACDRMGILVWQDFAMACAFYPNDPDFLNRIRQETESIVKRLRQHPSLAIWSGDNECDFFTNICQGYGNLDPNRNVITREVIPAVLLKQDPGRSYLPSSPYMSHFPMPYYAEDHLWGPRNYFKSAYYDQSPCSFASEIGYHGCPSPDSIEKFISKDRLWPHEDNPEWLCHATAPYADPYGNFNYRIGLMADQVQEMFGEKPGSLERFSLLSQFVQAEAMKHFIERFRVEKWRKTGLIWWNLLDGWPQFSDAVVDYYFRKKIAFSYIRSAQQPVCLIMTEPEGWDRKAFICNDTAEAVTCTYTITDLTDGSIAASGTAAVGAGDKTCVLYARCCSTYRTMYLLEWTTADGVSFRNHYLAGYPVFDADWYISMAEKAGIWSRERENEAT